jgi:formate/nitrite transporter FocA (FNT family)
MTGIHPWSSYLTGYLIPTLIGNIIGGVALVSALNHAQVISGSSAESKPQVA